MFFKILLNNINGYIRITVEGFFIEKFINICRFKGIFLWNIKREKASIMHANISIKDFKKIKQISKKIKCIVHIENKKGIPFLLNKHKKRKVFLIGILVLLIFVYVLSKFIWNIEIIGNERISNEEIIEALNSEELKVGRFKGKIDKNSIVNSVRLKRNDISWMGIDIKGTNAVVKIVETQEKPKIINKDEYCNIVADKEGIIEKITANNGTALVKKGDVIQSGDILIGGWMEGKFTGTRYVHATGNIYARIPYIAEEIVHLKQVNKEKTGKNEKKYQIKINNFNINFYKTLSKFEKYDTIYTTKKIKIFSDFYLPVEIVECSNFEIMENEEKYSMEQAKEIGIKRAEEKLIKEIKSTENIINKNINISEMQDSIKVEIIYEVLENIGTEEKIVF